MFASHFTLFILHHVFSRNSSILLLKLFHNQTSFVPGHFVTSCYSVLLCGDFCLLFLHCLYWWEASIALRERGQSRLSGSRIHPPSDCSLNRKQTQHQTLNTVFLSSKRFVFCVYNHSVHNGRKCHKFYLDFSYSYII